MTATTDLTANIVVMNRVLADATVECPECGLNPPETRGTMFVDGPGVVVGCDTCPGTGRVARFPGFRQECSWCRGKKRILKHFLVIGDEPYKPVDDDYDPCTHCHKQGWQVRAGGLHDALAGLTRGQASDVLYGLMGEWPHDDDPMPPTPEILAKSLELTIKAAELTTHSPSEATITGAKYIP